LQPPEHTKNINILEAPPGKHSIDSLQKTAILGTSHVIRKVLHCETWILSGGGHRWFKGSTGKERPVTGYDDDDDDDDNLCFAIYVHKHASHVPGFCTK
jgi:hypothetical protein